MPTDVGLDKWSTDEEDGAIDPGSWGDGDTKPATPLLDTIEYPVHLKHLKLPQLRQLCKEIRADLIHTVSKVRGCPPHGCWLPSSVQGMRAGNMQQAQAQLSYLAEEAVGSACAAVSPVIALLSSLFCGTLLGRILLCETPSGPADTGVAPAQTGGHLGSSLGVVELTTALLHVFSSPDDKIVYDVGHQAYVHKMLTGRRKLMPTIRQTGGISGAHGCCCW